MAAPRLRNFLLALALVLLVCGAALRVKGHPFSWYVIGASILLYIFARFFLKR